MTKPRQSLYINEIKDGDKTRYFVGIQGDIKAFEKLGSTANDLGQMVDSKKVVEFGLTNETLARWGGAATFEPGEHGDNQNTRVLVNPNQMDVTNRALNPNTLLGASRFAGQNLPSRSRWIVRPFEPRTVAWHEFGHAWNFVNGTSMPQTNPKALEWENRMREQLYGPLGPYNARRILH